MALEFLFPLVYSVCLIQLTTCGTLKDVEFIPEEIRTPGSELLGKSLSLDIGTAGRQRRNFHLPEDSHVFDDQYGAATQLSDGFREAGGSRYGGEQEGRRYYGAEDEGTSHGTVGFYGRAAKKGSSGHASDDAYLDSTRASHGDRSDVGHYDDRSGVNKEHDVAKLYQGEQSLNRQGSGVQRVGAKGGHRKGHHKTGFTNSYHKDEVGNKSDYFDEDLDQGGHFVLNTRDDAFYDGAAAEERGRSRDAAERNQAQGKKGSFDQGRRFEDRRGQKEHFGRDKYYDDRLNYGQKKAGEQFGRVIHEAGEQRAANQLDNGAHVYGQQKQIYQPQQVAVVPVDNYGHDYYPANEPVRVSSGVQGYYPSPSQLSPGAYYPPKTGVVREYYPYAGRAVPLLQETKAIPQYYVPPRGVYYTHSGY